MFYRLMAVALCLLMGYLAKVSKDMGVANFYSGSSQAFATEMARTRDGKTWGEYLVGAETRINKARRLFPGNALYSKQAADLAESRRAAVADSEEWSELFSYSENLMRAALTRAPVRSDLWTRLARYLYEREGASELTVHALERALYFGPREMGPHLLSARITLEAHSQLSRQARVRGWDAIVAAMSIPKVDTRVRAIVRKAGMQRQLDSLLRQKARERAILERREAAGG